MTTTEKAIQELMHAAARVRGLDIDDIYVIRGKDLREKKIAISKPIQRDRDRRKRN